MRDTKRVRRPTCGRPFDHSSAGRPKAIRVFLDGTATAALAKIAGIYREQGNIDPSASAIVRRALAELSTTLAAVVSAGGAVALQHELALLNRFV